MANATKQQIDLGEFDLERETPGTFRFSTERNGRKLTQYVSKSDLPLGTPSKIRVILEFET